MFVDKLLQKQNLCVPWCSAGQGALHFIFMRPGNSGEVLGDEYFTN